ncbi:heavy metal-resistance ArsR family transcriptional regulator [Candidatus Termititenax persephonae]|uniref:Heavy metal-resistance ArsR family transcriptional regulator n=1 Tax=Candidatus Termititenax persephonae TaxID=2218525 RepID=A0A388TEH8_9BACT|nr:heavy metal-resistance ArsR family transcriptional regulator [Candidatus Termititenax persephonae]
MNVQLFNHNNDSACDCCVIHQKLVKQVRQLMPAENSLLELADLLKVFGDSTRVKIISALLHAELCVCDIAALLGMTKSAISHQLRALRQTKLVKHRKAGKIVYYSLDDEHVEAIFKLGLAHVRERK